MTAGRCHLDGAKSQAHGSTVHAFGINASAIEIIGVFLYVQLTGGVLA